MNSFCFTPLPPGISILCMCGLLALPRSQIDEDASALAVKHKTCTTTAAVNADASSSGNVDNLPPTLPSNAFRRSMTSSTSMMWPSSDHSELSTAMTSIDSVPSGANISEMYPSALYGWSYHPTSLDYVNNGSSVSTSKVYNSSESCGSAVSVSKASSNSEPLPSTASFPLEHTSESPFCTEYSYKNLLYGSRSSLKPHYYNSAVYGGQYFPSYQSSGVLYPATNGQAYSSDPGQTYNRSFKTSPHPSLSAYFGSSGVSSASSYYSSGVYGSSGLSGCANDSHFGASWYNTPPGIHYYAMNTYAPPTAPSSMGIVGGYGLSPLANSSAIIDEKSLSMDQASPFSKTELKKGKNKKRKQISISPTPENSYDRVFVWDLEETCIIYQSLLSGAYASKYNKDQALASSLRARIDEMIIDLTEYFAFNELEDYDQVHIDDATTADELLATDIVYDYGLTPDAFQLGTTGATLCLTPQVRGGVDWVRKLALRYHRIREIYEMFRRTDMAGILGGVKHDQWLELRHNQWLEIRAELETLTNSWHTKAAECISLISTRSTQGLRCANVLVTNTQLVPTFSKLLLYNFARFFSIDNVYSSAKIGKEQCFERIMNRFGKKCTYVIVGDGQDEELAAKQLQLPFWRIASQSDLTALHDALKKCFL